jgi:hypothetical protein
MGFGPVELGHVHFVVAWCWGCMHELCMLVADKTVLVLGMHVPAVQACCSFVLGLHVRASCTSCACRHHGIVSPVSLVIKGLSLSVGL